MPTVSGRWGNGPAKIYKIMKRPIRYHFFGLNEEKGAGIDRGIPGRGARRAISVANLLISGGSFRAS